MSSDTNNTLNTAFVIALRKLGIVEMLLTDDDMKSLDNLPAEEMPALVAISEEDGLHLILVTSGEAQALQEEQESRESSNIIVPHPFN